MSCGFNACIILGLHHCQYVSNWKFALLILNHEVWLDISCRNKCRNISDFGPAHPLCVDITQHSCMLMPLYPLTKKRRNLPKNIVNDCPLAGLNSATPAKCPITVGPISWAHGQSSVTACPEPEDWLLLNKDHHCFLCSLPAGFSVSQLSCRLQWSSNRALNDHRFTLIG